MGNQWRYDGIIIEVSGGPANCCVIFRAHSMATPLSFSAAVFVHECGHNGPLVPSGDTTQCKRIRETRCQACVAVELHNNEAVIVDKMRQAGMADTAPISGTEHSGYPGILAWTARLRESVGVKDKMGLNEGTYANVDPSAVCWPEQLAAHSEVLNRIEHYLKMSQMCTLEKRPRSGEEESEDDSPQCGQAPPPSVASVDEMGVQTTQKPPEKKTRAKQARKQARTEPPTLLKDALPAIANVIEIRVMPQLRQLCHVPLVESVERQWHCDVLIAAIEILRQRAAGRSEEEASKAGAAMLDSFEGVNSRFSASSILCQPSRAPAKPSKAE